MEYAVGVDVGGTFTDVVVSAGDGRITVAKCLSTHDDPADGILRGIGTALARADASPGHVTRVVHATTLATNAVLTRGGERVAYVTTAGFRSAIPLGRYARVEEDRYDLRFDPPPPPVAPQDCFEVPERVDARGEVLLPLDEPAVRTVAAEIVRRGITAVAVCLLHSYANPAHERRVAEILRETLPGVVASFEIWPELREYERATTTIMSAYIGPVMSRYLDRLQERLLAIGVRAPVHVMDSAGGVMSARLASRRAVATIESGPAAGVLAAAAAGYPDVISFDMGGTTAKTCVIRGGRPEITHEFHVGGKGSFGGRRAGTGVPIKMPAIDLAEVGAGGGSIAWLDAAGALRVGPRSAGSAPGPACYDLGGEAPTVTDADLLLGYLSPTSFTALCSPRTPETPAEAPEALPSGEHLDPPSPRHPDLRFPDHRVPHEGDLRFPGHQVPHEGVRPERPDPPQALSTELATKAVERHLAGPLGVSTAEAAHAVHEIVNAAMGSAVQVVTVQRGIDPRGFVLVAFGGAGPMHAARIAARFGIGTVVVPAFCGVASAAGLLTGALSTDRVRSMLDAPDPEAVFAALTEAAAADLGVSPGAPSVTVTRTADVRFTGQAHDLTVPWTGSPADLAEHFHARYREVYGIAQRGPIETVGYRVRVTHHPGDRAAAVFRADPPAPTAGPASRPAYFPELGGYTEVPVLTRSDLAVPVEGPAVVEDPESTIVVPPGWHATRSGDGAVVMRRAGG
ncbi:hydantoinase/oxoprolinase family protein [Streptosporangium sp. KLBMP 9127]|nr:hydantoinase/oxoprolinase family protein [Streptosporangium sp. KLBMP 9127]